MNTRMDSRTASIAAAITEAEAYGLRVEIAERSGSHVVSLLGEAGVWNTAPLQAALPVLAARKPRNVVIDLSDCTLLSSLAIAALIGLYRGVRPHGGVVRLAGAPAPILEIIRTLRLEQLFPLHATVAEALGAPHRRISA